MGERGDLARTPRLTREELHTVSHAGLRKTLHAMVNQADGPLLRLLLQVARCCTQLRENTVAKRRVGGDG